MRHQRRPAHPLLCWAHPSSSTQAAALAAATALPGRALTEDRVLGRQRHLRGGRAGACGVRLDLDCNPREASASGAPLAWVKKLYNASACRTAVEVERARRRGTAVARRAPPCVSAELMLLCAIGQLGCGIVGLLVQQAARHPAAGSACFCGLVEHADGRWMERTAIVGQVAQVGRHDRCVCMPLVRAHLRPDRQQTRRAAQQRASRWVLVNPDAPIVQRLKTRSSTKRWQRPRRSGSSRGGAGSTCRAVCLMHACQPSHCSRLWPGLAACCAHTSSLPCGV